MELEIRGKEYLKEQGPQFLTQECHLLDLLFDYIKETKDLSPLKDTKVKKVIIVEVGDLWRFEFVDGTLIELNNSSVAWLKTHHYISSAIFYKERLLELYEKIKNLDKFPLMDWKIKRQYYYNSKKEITYDRNSIYINSISTGLPFTPETYKMVYDNTDFWTQGFKIS